jgi:hypothetical protein
MTMSVLTQTGFVCEFSQAVESVSLGERETNVTMTTKKERETAGREKERGRERGRERGNRVTIGDIMLRMNHLLSHPTDSRETERETDKESVREGEGEGEDCYVLREGTGGKLTGYMLTGMMEALTASGLYDMIDWSILPY